MRQLTSQLTEFLYTGLSKLPMRQLTEDEWNAVYAIISKLPMRQLTRISASRSSPLISKLPMRQLTVGFYANILILPKLASSYSYLTKILYACQKPWFTRPASKGKILGYNNNQCARVSKATDSTWHETSTWMSGFRTHFRPFAGTALSRKSTFLHLLSVCGNWSTCFSTYNTAGWREAIVSTSSPLLNRFMIKI